MNTLDRIKSLCDRNGITIAELERQVNVGNGTIRRWNTTLPSGDKLQRVAEYLNVTIDHLINGEENNNRIFGLNGDSEDMLNSYGGLNSEEKEEAKAFLKFLHSQNKSKGDKNCL